MDVSTVRIYGLPERSCDTMKKALTWLREHGLEYELHDYKKERIHESTLNKWIIKVGWEVLLNRRGMMWRKVPQNVKETIDEQSAIRLMLDTPSIIKRPVLVVDDNIEVGFGPERYAEIFDKSN